ncbi:MAG: DUF4404 family protein [Chloroflexi bacterium]|nr:DUF4404 family protein [Chloroflexota bacterium]MBI3340897.1 DUF4404 family protein [Chloroflexota bacterium]
MDDKKLRKLLEQLHDELEHTQSLDGKGRALLRDLDADIRSLLNRSKGDALQAQPQVLERLEETIDHLEITHPTLTMALSELLTVLNNAGI